LRAISTKSLEEQWQLLGTLEALNGMLLFGLRGCLKSLIQASRRDPVEHKADCGKVDHRL
jgi:hypothetical protein